MPVPLALLPRRWAVIATALVGVALAVAHQGLWSLLLTVVLVTFVLAPDGRGRRRSLVDTAAWLPIGAMVLLSVVIVVAVATGLVGLSLWSDQAAPYTWSALVLLIASAGIRRGGRVALVSWPSAVAWLPAMVLAGAQVYRHLQPLSYWSRPIWTGTDWMSHAVMVIDLRTRGLLDYRLPTPNSGDVPDIYPRGLHALLAWMAQVSGAPASGAVTWEGTLWVLSIVMAGMAVLTFAGAGLMAVTLAQRLGLPRSLVVVAAIVTGLVLAYPTTYDVLFSYGFATTAGVAVALYALLLVADAGPRTAQFSLRLVLAMLLTISVFNLWQLMALPFVLVSGWMGWQWWRAGHRHAWTVVVVAGGLVVGCLPLGIYTFTGTAVQHVNTPGWFSPFSVVFTIMACALSVAVVVTATRPRPLPAVAVTLSISLASILALGIALLVYTHSSWDDVSYYPGKLLWHATVLSLPALVVSFGYLLWRAWTARWFVERGANGRPLRWILVAAPVVLVVAFFGGSASLLWLQSVGGLAGSGGDSPQVAMLVAEEPDLLGAPGQSVIIWKLHPQGWQFWAKFEDVHATQIARSMGHPVPELPVVADHRITPTCTWLREHPDAVRITGPRHGERDLLAGGCPESVVRPDEWVVALTPPQWWLDTRWEATGGAMDPNLGELGDTRAVPAPTDMSTG